MDRIKLMGISDCCGLAMKSSCKGLMYERPASYQRVLFKDDWVNTALIQSMSSMIDDFMVLQYFRWWGPLGGSKTLFFFFAFERLYFITGLFLSFSLVPGHQELYVFASFLHDILPWNKVS